MHRSAWIFVALVAGCVCLAGGQPAPAVAQSAGTIREGDTLFLRGRVVECGHRPVLVEYAKVGPSGEVTLLDVTVPVVGRYGDEVASLLADGLERRTGSRPQSLEIVVVDPEDHKTRATLLLVLISQMRGDCGPHRRPRWPDRDAPLAYPEPGVRVAAR